MDRPGDSRCAGADADAGCPGRDRRFDGWAASYDLSQLQAVLYGPVHDAVLRYARQHAPDAGTVLDVGCGTGRLPARLASAYGQAYVVGADASAAMIGTAVTARAASGFASRSVSLSGCRLPTPYSTWPWRRCRYRTGVTRRSAWPSSPA